MKCIILVNIAGTAMPNTYPSVYDPGNVMGGQQSHECGKPATHKGWNGTPVCLDHYEEWISLRDRLKT